MCTALRAAALAALALALSRRRSRSGGLPRKCHPHHRAVPARRADRRRRPPARRKAEGPRRPERHRREPRRRRRRHRHRLCRAAARQRLHPAARLRHPRGQPGAAATAVRHAHRVQAGGDDRHHSEHHRRASGAALQDLRRDGGGGEEGAGPARLCDRRHRHRRASVDEADRAAVRHAASQRAVPRRRAGRGRCGRRPRADDGRLGAGARQVRAGRQGAGAGAAWREAPSDAARHADHGRARHEGFQQRVVDGDFRAVEHAGCDRHALPRRSGECAERSLGARTDGVDGRRADRRIVGRPRRSSSKPSWRAGATW